MIAVSDHRHPWILRWHPFQAAILPPPRVRSLQPKIVVFDCSYPWTQCQHPCQVASSLESDSHVLQPMIVVSGHDCQTLCQGPCQVSCSVASHSHSLQPMIVWCPAITILGMDARALIKQQLDHCLVFILRGPRQRRLTISIFRLWVSTLVK
ncbi:unnamed protein product [Penicillium nalgiovense]|nr:unnamed protein product [Penicillium nalgiovense]CAG8104634.1 unnamed protein product [Penicillium nalgiovense]